VLIPRNQQKFRSDLSAVTRYNTNVERQSKLSLSRLFLFIPKQLPLHTIVTMPAAHDPPIVALPTNGAVNGTVNGTNGDKRPHTPTTGMSLTEYSANPSTPSEEKRARIKEIVPEEYLLPTGYPDVSFV
jgi:hypothetical protein